MTYTYYNKQREINLKSETFQDALELLLKIDSHLDKYKDKGLVKEIHNIMKYGSPVEPKAPISQEEIYAIFDEIFPVGTILYPENGRQPRVSESFGEWEKIPYATWFDGIKKIEYFLYKRVK